MRKIYKPYSGKRRTSIVYIVLILLENASYVPFAICVEIAALGIMVRAETSRLAGHEVSENSWCIPAFHRPPTSLPNSTSCCGPPFSSGQAAPLFAAAQGCPGHICTLRNLVFARHLRANEARATWITIVATQIPRRYLQFRHGSPAQLEECLAA